MCVCVCVCSCLRVRKNVNLRKSAAAPGLREERQAVLNPPPAGGIPVPGILGCGVGSVACDYRPPGPRVGCGSGPSGSRVFWCWPLFCCCSSSSFPPLSSFSTSPFSPLWSEDLILFVIVITHAAKKILHGRIASESFIIGGGPPPPPFPSWPQVALLFLLGAGLMDS